MQWQAPTTFSLKNSTDFYAQSCAVRTWTLDITSTRQALALVFTRQSMVASGRMSRGVHVTVAHEPFAHGNLDTTFSSLVPGGTLSKQYLVRQWIRVPGLFSLAFGRIS